MNKELLLVATDNIVNGLNACSLDLEVMYTFSDLCHNGFYDLAYELACDFNIKMNDADRISLKYIFYHAKEDFKNLL